MTRVAARHLPTLAFGAALLLALGFALYTDHVWEDYYITYRSSKNLATGHGLVFNHGEKLHTFTSPLGVLLPAVASLLTGNSSDTAALWIFRVMCAATLGGGVALLVSLSQRLRYPTIAVAFLAALLLTDAKVLDFTINGMETAFMVLFLAYALWAHFAPGPRQWLHLGAAWAGLMWTRPDSFIYVALIAAGVWLFNKPELTGGDRRQQFFLFLRAGLLTSLLYAPWLLWATWYYGTPIPHTIVAKGGMSDGGGARLLGGSWRMPWLIWQGKTAAEGAFLPSYFMFPTWPAWMLPFGRALATIGLLLWLVPRLRPEVKAASLAFFGGVAYLSFVPYFPFPWYFPSTFVLAAVALAGGFAQAWTSGRRWLRVLASFAAAVTLLLALALTVGVARQVRAQQAIIETGNRRLLGEWLRANSAPGDAVFMEPLGYIGFFSGLKTYDWPGMSSPEVVAARQRVGSSWGAILRHLQPRWIVLRPFEAGRIDQEDPGFLTNYYELVRTFERNADIATLDVPGRRYLEHDAHFVVFRLRPAPLHDPATINLRRAGGVIAPTRRELPPNPYQAVANGQPVSVVQAPSTVEFPLPSDLVELTGGLGVLDRAWTAPRKVGPVDFSVSLIRADESVEPLMQRRLDPLHEPADRGYRPFRVPLPATAGGRLRLTISAAAETNGDVPAYWGGLEVTSARTTLDVNGAPQFSTGDTKAQFGFANTDEDGEPCTFAHAPTALVYDWQEGMNRLEAGFGLLRGAYSEGGDTDGVVFVVEVEEASGRRVELFRRHLDPVREKADRGPQSLSVAIPPTPDGRLILRTDPPPSGRLNHAWSYWRNLQARR